MKIMKKRLLLTGALSVGIALSGFGQDDCDKYLDKQSKVVKTGGIVLKLIGKVADVVLGTNFSSLSRPDELQMLDNIQYETCMKLQTVKNEFNRENLEAKINQTIIEMLKLVNESNALPSNVVEQLLIKGINPSNGNLPAPPQNPVSITNANDVPVTVLPEPEGWNKIIFPCQDVSVSSAGVIRARGMESSMDPQIAKDIANTVALEELASKIEVAVKSTTQYFIDRTETKLNEELNKRFKRKIELSVEQTIRGYRTVCEEYRQHSQTQKYQCFVALEINEDAVLKPIHDELQKETGLQKAVPNYQKFKDAFYQTLSFFEKTGMN